MIRYAVVLCALVLASCATGNSAQDVTNAVNWTSLVQPKDLAPGECTVPPQPEPKMPAKALKGSEAAREDRRLRLAYRKLRAAYKRCQRWAKGQR